MAHIIDGNVLARKILEETRQRVASLTIRPGMAALLIGDNAASELYVRIKERRCQELGIYFEKIVFPEDATQRAIVETIQKLNTRTDIHAILIQLPLPAHLSTEQIVSAMDPKKDVDGFHPENIERFMADTPPYIQPVLIKAILALIKAPGVSLRNKKTVILGKSDVFMRPLGSALLRMQMQVLWQTIEQQWCNHSCDADVIISALGRPHSIQPHCVKPGAICIDVGITRVGNEIQGDFAPGVEEVAGYITPVPGGVGPMTVAMLLSNVVELASRAV